MWAAASTLVGSRRPAGPALVGLGLLTASAVIVHLSPGVIEAHFHFYVVIVLLAVHEDWMIFLLATAFVVVHHGVLGALEPGTVFNHRGAAAHPWRWALVHAAAVAPAGLGAVLTWRLNEALRDEHAALPAEKQGRSRARPPSSATSSATRATSSAPTASSRSSPPSRPTTCRRRS